MKPICYRCHRFPPQITQHAIWLYCRFTLSFRDVEDLLAERRLDVPYETVRRWVLKFGHSYAPRHRRFRPKPDDRWHLDEMFVTIRGRQMYLWRAVVAGRIYVISGGRTPGGAASSANEIFTP